MFQFRAFPSHDYFIHHVIHRYCLCGFPHSDISGSQLICSSPKLFAACHVLHRLLMPRHPPCALFRLTSLYDLHHSAVLKKELCKSSLQNFEIVIVTLHMHFHTRVVPQSFLLAFLSLCSFFSCSVFKVRTEDIHKVYPLN